MLKPGNSDLRSLGAPREKHDIRTFYVAARKRVKVLKRLCPHLEHQQHQQQQRTNIAWNSPLGTTTILHKMHPESASRCFSLDPLQYIYLQFSYSFYRIANQFFQRSYLFQLVFPRKIMKSLYLLIVQFHPDLAIQKRQSKGKGPSVILRPCRTKSNWNEGKMREPAAVRARVC